MVSRTMFYDHRGRKSSAPGQPEEEWWGGGGRGGRASAVVSQPAMHGASGADAVGEQALGDSAGGEGGGDIGGGEERGGRGDWGGGGVLDIRGGEGGGSEEEDGNGEEEDGGFSDDCADSAADDDGDGEMAEIQPVAAADDTPKNQVILPVEQFKEVIHDLAFFCLSVHHLFSRDAVQDLLRLQSLNLHYRSPFKQERLANAAVDLHETLVEVCPAGCIAYTAGRSSFSECDICKQPRYKRGSTTPHKQVTYWPMTPWLTAMMEDPVLGKDMTVGMSHARARASQPRSSVEDWYDGENFRNAVNQGCFQADTDVALSLSTVGSEAWRQQGLQGWPVVVAILNLDAQCRSSLVKQLLLCVTPGPKQPADLE